MHRVLAPVLLLAIFALPARAQDESQDPPCLRNASQRAFDFWIGSWDVRSPEGRIVGTNRIERILDGCVLLENWSGAGGSAGKSFNYFDPGTDEWRQLWVDAAGGHMEYRGTVSNGAMRFEGGNVRPDGTASRMRMTFTPLGDGRVRQYIEESVDDGATWATWFDGYYSRTDG